MTWHILKRFDGEWSGWHLCSECFDEWRLKTVQAAVQGNAHGREPERLIDPGRWYEFSEDDLAGTRLWELSCYGCGEYIANDDVLRDEEIAEVPLGAFLDDPLPAPPEPEIKYFSNMPPLDPDEKPKTVKKSKAKMTGAWENMFGQVMEAEAARVRFVPEIAVDPQDGPDF